MDERTALPLLQNRFELITGLKVEDWEEQPACVGDAVRADARLSAGSKQFIVDYKPAATTEQIGAALRGLALWKEINPEGVIPLLVVPYMGRAGQELCRLAGISWLDLSGNADISAPPIRVRILGEPNHFKRAGRPASMFAPRSSRIARVLLLNPDRVYTQGDLASCTALSTGFLSRLLPRYEEAGFLERTATGRLAQYYVRDPHGLLDAWSAAYLFADHTILRGHVAARTGPELLRELAQRLADRQERYAATGLAAAWLLEPFAGFRLTTLYLPTWPSSTLLSYLNFHEGARGSNTWLVVPNDEGVFQGAQTLNGVRCTSAVQVYLDLKGHPERAAEAAGELRRKHLSWSCLGKGTGP